MLNNYLAQVNRLLHNQAGTLYNQTDLTSYINLARNQIAMEGECIKVLAPLNTASGNNLIEYSSIGLPGGLGLASVYSVAALFLNSVPLEGRSWPWFSNFYLPRGGTGIPSAWAQYSQGVSGSAYLWPTPNAIIGLYADTVCVPNILLLDTDPEALPYPWQDCVQFFACYWALLSAQRYKDAENMFAQYELFAKRARAMVTPSILPENFEGGEGARRASSMQPIGPAMGNPGGRRAV